MGYNVHDIFDKVMVYNILNLTFKNHLFGRFEIIIIFQDET
jgi:hypothetical protein